MNYFDGELESVANSIERDLNKRYKYKLFFYFLLFITAIFTIYNSIEYPDGQNTPPINIFINLILLFITVMGLTIINDETGNIFKNMREKIFFYLFISWKFHNDKKSKKYLKKCIDALDIYLNNYKNLAYTKDIYSSFDELHDTLKFHIYPKLGERGDVENQGDLGSQVSAWDEF